MDHQAFTADGAIPSVPTLDEFIWTTVLALRDLGGSASIEEIEGKAAEIMALPIPILEIPHGDTQTTEIHYRMSWARTYLKKCGAIINSERGVWSLTPKGRILTKEDAGNIPQVVRKETRLTRKVREINQKTNDALPIEEIEPIRDWKEKLLQKLQSIPPDAFERLAQRLLREAGFIKVEVTGKSGDGGIDGKGILRQKLVSFHVLFQCKRYKDAVGSSAIRDFRGAMVGRTDKGLFITTGRFTRDAEIEATRDGAPPIDLIDGQQMCELLREHKLGVVPVQDYDLDEDFFSKL